MRIDELTPELLPVVAPLLASEDGRASRADLAGFVRFVTAHDWRGCFFGPATQPRAAAVAALSPGGVGMLFAGARHLDDVDVDTQTELVAQVLRLCSSATVRYMQALVSHRPSTLELCLARCGFEPLTTLQYVGRPTHAAQVAPDPGATWLAYRQDLRDDFVRMLSNTYRDSLDCPELTRLRTPDEALAAHAATGAFRPDCWELLLIDDVLCGCVLTAPVEDRSLLELVYMGVEPDARGRGLGAVLLRRAQWHAARCRLGALVAAVDVRNGPALRVYEQAGMRLLAERHVLIRTEG